MKNTTLARKPKNEMHKGAGEYRPHRSASQAGDGADFAFNGQMGDGVNRDGSAHRYSGNHTGLKSRENYGMGPRRGNASDSGDERHIGPSVTRDHEKLTIATASQGHNTQAGATKVKRPPNPDAIYVE